MIDDWESVTTVDSCKYINDTTNDIKDTMCKLHVKTSSLSEYNQTSKMPASCSCEKGIVYTQGPHICISRKT